MLDNPSDDHRARVAVVQAAPVLFDTPKSLQKLADLTADPKEINALGFMLGDKKAEPFKMEIAGIKVIRAGK